MAQVANDADSARLLIEAGAQLEALDDTGRTPLALAAAYGNLEASIQQGHENSPRLELGYTAYYDIIIYIYKLHIRSHFGSR